MIIDDIELDGEILINTITREDIESFRKINQKGFANATREDMLEVLTALLNAVKESGYLTYVTQMKIHNVSEEWGDRVVDDEFVCQRFDEELEDAKSCSLESLALKICYWSNRVAHQIEKEVVGSINKRQKKNVYTRHCVNTKKKIDVFELRNTARTGEPKKKLNLLYNILKSERKNLADIDTPEKLTDMFLGIQIREELYSVKQEMIKRQLYEVGTKSVEDSSLVITALEETKNMQINGSPTLRLVIREVGGLAPVVMHCNKNVIGEFLERNSLPEIPIETDPEIADFARGREGVVGIHFTLSDEDRQIVAQKLEHNPRVDRLHGLKIDRVKEKKNNTKKDDDEKLEENEGAKTDDGQR